MILMTEEHSKLYTIMNDLINVFDKTAECDYKGEHYSARDNGAVMRHPKSPNSPRPLDNKWMFGRKDDKTGYMFIGSARIHQIIATAFYGQPEFDNMIVDHIDTNRCNNRADNLRWVTRIENVLNNPITRRKIILCCGSIEAFLDNPTLLRENASDPNTTWMRTVSKEQADRCRQHLEKWAAEDKIPVGKGIGDWVLNEAEFSPKSSDSGESWNKDWVNWKYKSPWQIEKEQREKAIVEEMERLHKEWYGLKDSLTPGAKQRNWKFPAQFPLCPSSFNLDDPLRNYLENLKEGEIFAQTKYYKSLVYRAGISEDGKTLAVITSIPDGIKPFALALITFEDGYYIHTSEQTYFNEEGATKYYTIALGREWTGGDVFDDYC